MFFIELIWFSWIRMIFVGNNMSFIKSYRFLYNPYEFNWICKISIESTWFALNLYNVNGIHMFFFCLWNPYDLNLINKIVMESNLFIWNPYDLYGICRIVLESIGFKFNPTCVYWICKSHWIYLILMQSHWFSFSHTDLHGI